MLSFLMWSVVPSLVRPTSTESCSTDSFFCGECCGSRPNLVTVFRSTRLVTVYHSHSDPTGYPILQRFVGMGFNPVGASPNINQLHKVFLLFFPWLRDG